MGVWGACFHEKKRRGNRDGARTSEKKKKVEPRSMARSVCGHERGGADAGPAPSVETKRKALLGC